MWLVDFFVTPSALQAVTVISAICALGLSLMRIKIRGIGLGITFVFFAGIAAGALGLQVDSSMLAYAQSFGLVLFIYTLGLQVGPGFASSFLAGGTKLNYLSIAIIFLGTLITVLFLSFGNLPIADVMGVLCGATTNTPALGAAQQTLSDLGQSSTTAALSCAVTYPIGTVAVILVIAIMKNWLTRHDRNTEKPSQEEVKIVSFVICNPAICGKTLKEINALNNATKCVVTRLWRKDEVFMPDATTILEKDDRLLVITNEQYVNTLTIFFGQKEDKSWENINWNSIDKNLVSQNILVTRPSVNGKKLSSLHFRERFGVTVSRVKRQGIRLVATSNLTIRMGDRLTIVGTKEGIERVSQEVGNMVKNLDDPNLVAIFVGVFIGLILGSFPIDIGLSYPIRLGLAGGSVVMGILIGALGPSLHMVSYTTTSANLMLRSLGLSTYLACLGLESGGKFLETVMQPAALVWIFMSLVIACVPIIIIGVYSVLVSKKSTETTFGMICGAMANPIALNYVNDLYSNEKASLAYVTVYPLGMFLRVIIAQVIVMYWFA